MADRAPSAEGGTPDVTGGMRAEPPDGPFPTGDALDAASARERWSASVHPGPEFGELVVVATGT